ncbi:hypothetical protein A2118_00905 [Candidatus Kaiserbacteria bacterium GWA2_50_9]|uniref:DUF488 domain-containing protein n=1 Tax=Candidatus Kaiserbacteria bacterium GWA2_50_9 TaxID=1798474 RepID=A0A1F6BUY6_9BACT|nr:MAG: hypothetical protein A2118_00905 [Candidatus Kaiserbacteria bacterium GWA2_50_9]
MATKKVFTVATLGHSNKTIETFLAVLEKHEIEVLVDVRSLPVSRFCPYFNKTALHATLAERDIQYLYRGKNLGGRAVNVGWDEAIEELICLAEDGKRVVVMCSESSYLKCHRYTTITPSLEERGIRIVHIQYENETAKHS